MEWRIPVVLDGAQHTLLQARGCKCTLRSWSHVLAIVAMQAWCAGQVCWHQMCSDGSALPLPGQSSVVKLRLVGERTPNSEEFGSHRLKLSYMEVVVLLAHGPMATLPHVDSHAVSTQSYIVHNQTGESYWVHGTVHFSRRYIVFPSCMSYFQSCLFVSSNTHSLQ